MKETVEKAIGNGEIQTGSGLNQELYFIRAGDTRRSSHYKTILHLIDLFPSIIKVLEFVEKEGNNGTNQNQANVLLMYFDSFDFVFYLHLMKHILGITYILSQALQRKNQDILEAVSTVKSTKKKLEDFRVNGFDPLLMKIYSFSEKHNIKMLNMKEDYFNPKSQRQRTNIINRHHYEFDCYNTVVDMQIQEFCDRFSEVSTQLLENMGALNPYDSFFEFDVSKLVTLSELYQFNFDNVEMMTLENQLQMFYANVSKDERFANLNDIDDLSREMVKTRKHISYPLVYRLLKLALVLNVANRNS